MSDIKNRPWHDHFIAGMRPWYDHFIAGMLLSALVVVAILAIKYTKEYNFMMNTAKTHIRVVIATDRNCNDCHLGASFINLFKHDAVKSDDNIVLLMMDKAKIKRW